MPALGPNGSLRASPAGSEGTTDTFAEPIALPAPRAPEVLFGWEDTRSDPRFGRWLVDIAPDPGAGDLPVLGAELDGQAAMALRRLIAQGRAAGHVGVFYDNRDNGHSRLNPERFPQLTHIRYAPELIERRLHNALAGPFLFGAPVLGNASMAVTGGRQPRSLPRLAMTTQQGPHLAFAGYASNHLYVYPAHHDVREVDVMPAALPYFAVSFGSSGSDQPLLNGLALALAALQPETRTRAEAEGLLAPLLTMLLRRSLSGAPDYLSPYAHPPAIERGRVRPAVMVAAAQSIMADAIPPMVQLRILAEDFRASAGLAGRSERLFDTPSAVARLWRDWAGRRTMVVSAADTVDPNGRPLEFRWAVVSGDPDRIRIEPLDPSGRAARITVDWHDAPFPTTPRGRPTSRVEVAVVAWNGAHYSAPALISIAFPGHQQRIFVEGADGAPMLVSVDYDAEARDAAFDPVLWWSAPWTDTAIRDDDGRIIGWRRVAQDQVQILTDIAAGTHRVQAGDDGIPRLVWTP